MLLVTQLRWSVRIYVYGNIGDKWSEDGVVASEMVRDIAVLEADEIVLRINSYGGSVTDGLVTINALKRHPAPVSVQIDGGRSAAPVTSPWRVTRSAWPRTRR